MKVKIKSIEEMKKYHGEPTLIERKFKSNVPFVSPMYNNCDKYFYAKEVTGKIGYSTWNGIIYRLLNLDGKRFEEFVWADWMFDIVPEIENKNYLLEF